MNYFFSKDAPSGTFSSRAAAEVPQTEERMQEHNNRSVIPIRVQELIDRHVDGAVRSLWPAAPSPGARDDMGSNATRPLSSSETAFIIYSPQGPRPLDALVIESAAPQGKKSRAGHREDSVSRPSTAVSAVRSVFDRSTRSQVLYVPPQHHVAFLRRKPAGAVAETGRTPGKGTGRGGGGFPNTHCVCALQLCYGGRHYAADVRSKASASAQRQYAPVLLHPHQDVLWTVGEPEKTDRDGVWRRQSSGLTTQPMLTVEFTICCTSRSGTGNAPLRQLYRIQFSSSCKTIVGEFPSSSRVARLPLPEGLVPGQWCNWFVDLGSLMSRFWDMDWDSSTHRLHQLRVSTSNTSFGTSTAYTGDGIEQPLFLRRLLALHHTPDPPNTSDSTAPSPPSRHTYQHHHATSAAWHLPDSLILPSDSCGRVSCLYSPERHRPGPEPVTAPGSSGIARSGRSAPAYRGRSDLAVEVPQRGRSAHSAMEGDGKTSDVLSAAAPSLTDTRVFEELQGSKLSQLPSSHHHHDVVAQELEEAAVEKLRSGSEARVPLQPPKHLQDVADYAEGPEREKKRAPSPTTVGKGRHRTRSFSPSSSGTHTNSPGGRQPLLYSGTPGMTEVNQLLPERMRQEAQTPEHVLTPEQSVGDKSVSLSSFTSASDVRTEWEAKVKEDGDHAAPQRRRALLQPGAHPALKNIEPDTEEEFSVLETIIEISVPSSEMGASHSEEERDHRSHSDSDEMNNGMAIPVKPHRLPQTLEEARQRAKAAPAPEGPCLDRVSASPTRYPLTPLDTNYVRTKSHKVLMMCAGAERKKFAGVTAKERREAAAAQAKRTIPKRMMVEEEITGGRPFGQLRSHPEEKGFHDGLRLLKAKLKDRPVSHPMRESAIDRLQEGLKAAVPLSLQGPVAPPPAGAPLHASASSLYPTRIPESVAAEPPQKGNDFRVPAPGEQGEDVDRGTRPGSVCSSHLTPETAQRPQIGGAHRISVEELSVRLRELETAHSIFHTPQRSVGNFRAMELTNAATPANYVSRPTSREQVKTGRETPRGVTAVPSPTAEEQKAFEEVRKIMSAITDGNDLEGPERAERIISMLEARIRRIRTVLGIPQQSSGPLTDDSQLDSPSPAFSARNQQPSSYSGKAGEEEVRPQSARLGPQASSRYHNDRNLRKVEDIPAEEEFGDESSAATEEYHHPPRRQDGSSVDVSSLTSTAPHQQSSHIERAAELLSSNRNYPLRPVEANAASPVNLDEADESELVMQNGDAIRVETYDHHSHPSAVDWTVNDRVSTAGNVYGGMKGTPEMLSHWHRTHSGLPPHKGVQQLTGEETLYHTYPVPEGDAVDELCSSSTETSNEGTCHSVSSVTLTRTKEHSSGPTRRGHEVLPPPPHRASHRKTTGDPPPSNPSSLAHWLMARGGARTAIGLLSPPQEISAEGLVVPASGEFPEPSTEVDVLELWRESEEPLWPSDRQGAERPAGDTAANVRRHLEREMVKPKPSPPRPAYRSGSQTPEEEVVQDSSDAEDEADERRRKRKAEAVYRIPPRGRLGNPNSAGPVERMAAEPPGGATNPSWQIHSSDSGIAASGGNSRADESPQRHTPPPQPTHHTPLAFHEQSMRLASANATERRSGFIEKLAVFLNSPRALQTPRSGAPAALKTSTSTSIAATPLVQLAAVMRRPPLSPRASARESGLSARNSRGVADLCEASTNQRPKELLYRRAPEEMPSELQDTQLSTYEVVSLQPERTDALARPKLSPDHVANNETEGCNSRLSWTFQSNSSLLLLAAEEDEAAELQLLTVLPEARDSPSAPEHWKRSEETIPKDALPPRSLEGPTTRIEGSPAAIAPVPWKHPLGAALPGEEGVTAGVGTTASLFGVSASTSKNPSPSVPVGDRAEWPSRRESLPSESPPAEPPIEAIHLSSVSAAPAPAPQLSSPATERYEQDGLPQTSARYAPRHLLPRPAPPRCSPPRIQPPPAPSTPPQQVRGSLSSSRTPVTATGSSFRGMRASQIPSSALLRVRYLSPFSELTEDDDRCSTSHVSTGRTPRSQLGIHEPSLGLLTERLSARPPPLPPAAATVAAQLGQALLSGCRTPAVDGTGTSDRTRAIAPLLGKAKRSGEELSSSSLPVVHSVLRQRHVFDPLATCYLDVRTNAYFGGDSTS